MNKEKKVRWLVWLDWSEGRARMRRDEIREVMGTDCMGPQKTL